ncbi:ArsR family transcriptional regulator [Halalkaliarchaeum sp. AArc-GB]|uniref:DUF7344 domain-containing protein n=1 Tax=Halalkaliarchaeum sp. AArc-GB TaxID=3074078 RepID=UPI00285AB5D7|nr:ArsR family transcriptional regulator [Halalkaliarchaeum sp. AArc-GB]MDR5673964.1 ArsR family transcriptional regulator [Halalkaliarchaeum sp. AArc-GB]
MTSQDLDACLELVADRRRRRIIRELRQKEDGETTVEALVDRLDASEWAGENDSHLDRDRIALHLHHNHLPKMADFDVVEYESGNGTVRYRGHERLEAILDSLPEESIPPSP